jgi:hypothetical protein
LYEKSDSYWKVLNEKIHVFLRHCYFSKKQPLNNSNIDAKIPKYDLFFERDPDSTCGFYKGKAGSAQSLVRTSVLSNIEISEIKNTLYTKFKRQA